MAEKLSSGLVSPEFVYPDWPAPDNVRAAFTTRIGGYSEAPCDGFNLGLHVGDNAQHVSSNRKLLIDALSLPAAPLYLNQVHGTDAVCAEEQLSDNSHTLPAADACWSSVGSVIAIMTADCLPVLFTSECGHVVAGAHAGWRGLADGVIENTILSLPVKASELLVWLGPAIGPSRFEVGAEVKECFVSSRLSSEVHFEAVDSMDNSGQEKYLANLYGLARDRLTDAGVHAVYGGEHCTYGDASRFFSHRRDRGQTGRMAALIWKV